MMKRLLLLFLLVFLCSPIWGDILDDNKISAGEYAFGVTWQSYDPPLTVDGGGADEISVGENGLLIVESTSTPLVAPWYENRGGVYDILLFDESQLLYKDGVTEYISVVGNAKATLKGGSINLIDVMKYPSHDPEPNVEIYCQDGWSWIDNDPLSGIEGNWLANGLPFYIEFNNQAGFDPVYENVEVITPEPTTLALLAFGCLLIRRKK